MERVYVVVLNWNGWRDTIACLESLLAQTADNYRIVVCDNASTDESIEKIQCWARGELVDSYVPAVPVGVTRPAVGTIVDHVVYDRGTAERGGASEVDPLLTLIQTGSNLGFAGGNNVGLRYAISRGDGRYFWLLNNDTYADRDALRALTERAARTSDTGIVGSVLRYFNRPDTVQAYGGASFCPLLSRARPICEGEVFRQLSPLEADTIERRLGYVIGASMLVSRQFIDRVGLMQEDYFLYFEELDWATRGRRCKSGSFKLAFSAHSIVFHKVGASTGSRARSLTSLRYLHSNELRFMKRFYPRLVTVTRLGLLVNAGKALLRGRVDEGRLLLTLAASRVTA